MRPVRVTTPGAGIGLPLRMVAAGTGAVTAVTLWVLGEGRHEPANFPSFTIEPKEVVWDWAASDSNYAKLKEAGFEDSNGAGWLVETALQFSSTNFESNIYNSIDFGQSGYGGPMSTYEEVQAEAQEDMAKLFGTLDPAQVWVTRLHAELPRAQLGKDLEVGASMTQEQVQNFIQCEKAVGTPPPCPTYDCGGDEGETEGFFDERFGPVTNGGSASDTGCAVGDQGSGTPWVVGLGLALAVVAHRRRKRG
jgi:MYXO-CTERM domain-containing protein